jgi:hypothetical protein
MSNAKTEKLRQLADAIDLSDKLGRELFIAGRRGEPTDKVKVRDYNDVLRSLERLRQEVFR